VVSIGAKWDKKVVTWSLANAGGEFTHRLSADEEKAVQRALDQWTEATGVIFKEVQQPAKADMVFGLGDLDTAESGVLGLAAIKKNDGVISRAIITLEDPALSPVVQSESGEELYANSDASFDQVLLHEIGHAVGFGDNIDPSSIENFDLTAANRTLSDADISSAAALYGKTASTGTEIHSAKAVDELVHARLSSNDTAQTAAMYGGEPTAVNVLHQIIHAMSSFAPAPMGSALAANDPDVSGHAMRYGGNYLIRRAN